MVRRIFELEASRHAQAIKALREQYPAEDPDSEAIQDTLEGMTDFHEVLDVLVRNSQRDELAAQTCKAEAEAMKKVMQETVAELLHRHDRLLARSRKTRERILCAFDNIGLPGIERPTYTLSRTHGPSRVIVTNPDRLPEEFLRRKPAPPPEPDLVAIGRALKSDNPEDRMALSEAAVLANGNPRLDVRRK